MILPCASCGKNNRIPAEHAAEHGTCGACNAPLPPVSEPIDADPTLFDEVMGKAKVPVLVDFWAAWCGPCKMAAPEVKQTAQNMAGRALVLKVDTDQHPSLAARYDVRGIPNFLVLRDGKVVKQQAGLVRHSQMESWLEEAGA